MSAGCDPRTEALREIVRLAREDRRRGIHHWFDPDLPDLLRELVREIGAGRPRAASRGRAGVARADATPARADDTPAGAAGPSARAAGTLAGAADTPWGPPPAATGRAGDWEAQLAAVAAEAAACAACGLCRTRRSVVFGAGTARVPLVFIGEAPGADEDAQGIPFVGRAGQLLTKIIAAIGIPREDVYICNVLKCRPPENRNPAPEEIAHCAPFLARQLEILKPKVICTLGLFATQSVLSTAEPIGKLRGRLFTRDGYKILPTYHPAALLRNPSLKATVWEDVQLLRRVLDE